MIENELKIDKNIPMPSINNKNLKVHNSLKLMQVGDSIFVANIRSAHISNMVKDLKKRSGIHNDIKFSSRQWEENKVRGVRVWRIL